LVLGCHFLTAKGGTSMISLSFFSGAMGLDIGLEKAGIETIFASEIDKSARKTIEANKPGIPLIGDLRDHNSKEILSIAGISDGENIDLIVGGPPCQAFSTAGKRLGFNDDRGNVFLNYIDTILEIRPKYAIIENVRGLLSAPLEHRPHDLRDEETPLSKKELSGGALLEVLSRFSSANYGVSFNLYNSANFGSPQVRERVIMICSRDGTEAPYLKPTHAQNGELDLPPWKTFRQATERLNPSDHTHVNFPDKRLKYFKMLKSGENWRNLPEDVQIDAMGKSYYCGGGKTGFFRRLDWDKPSPTLVTHPAMPATDLAHPEENRPLSIQEYRKIQEFPDNWSIEGSLINQYKQIGNAVPISLGIAVGKLLSSLHNAVDYQNTIDFPFSRYRSCDHKTWIKLANEKLCDEQQLRLSL
jgi:DNA (cytosine-5)-methyltransferase 1